MLIDAHLDNPENDHVDVCHADGVDEENDWAEKNGSDNEHENMGGWTYPEPQLNHQFIGMEIRFCHTSPVYLPGKAADVHSPDRAK